jgi:hypothetical protein
MSGARSAEREDLMVAIRLTIFFEDPFWVGVVERREEGTLVAARHLFGAEPAPAEVLEFVLKRMSRLIENASMALEVAPTVPRAVNPKRAARQAAKALTQRGSSTQAQQALRLALEQHKQVRKQQTKAEREAEADYKHRLKIQKAKSRHRGR